MAKTRKEINEAHVEGMKEIMERNNSRFIIGLALKDDGTVDALLNLHDSTLDELFETWRTFVKQYVSALEKMKKK